MDDNLTEVIDRIELFGPVLADHPIGSWSGDTARSVRDLLGFTQVEMGRVFGYSRNGIIDIEQRARLDMVVELAYRYLLKHPKVALTRAG
jgi:DNA-binding XRE family transcriptional regulator